MAKQIIHYQAYSYINDSTGQYQVKTIPVKNFAAVKIIVTGNNIDNTKNTVVVNNNIYLQPYAATLTGGATNPYILDLSNNNNEVDSTQITVKIPLGCLVTLIFKFFNS